LEKELKEDVVVEEFKAADLSIVQTREIEEGSRRNLGVCPRVEFNRGSMRGIIGIGSLAMTTKSSASSSSPQSTLLQDRHLFRRSTKGDFRRAHIRRAQTTRL